MSDVIFLYHLLVVLVLVTILINFLLNQLAVPRLTGGKTHPAQSPLVSILVPARNEEAGIARCLSSLQTQDYPNYEILLLDDQSSDRTAEIAGELGFIPGEGKCRILSGQPLPAGWVGKPWACHQLSQAARGEYLLFTDADTHHSPQALGAVMAEAFESKSDLLTLWPAQETKTWSEKLVIPILFVAAAGMLPHWLLVIAQKNSSIRQRLSARQWRMLGVANGQYVLFTRRAYDQIGGHEAVKNHMVEDVALGRLVASKTHEGMILRNCDGGAVVSTRMYQSFDQLWEGFSKNAWPIFEGDFRLFCIGNVGMILVFVGPFLFLPFSSVSWLMLLFQIGLIAFIRIVITLRYQSSWHSAVLHPVAFLLATAISINSHRQNRKQGLTWKGRTYQVN
ncbi:MAG: glycosyltransferase [Chthoniobacterales bacterium]